MNFILFSKGTGFPKVRKMFWTVLKTRTSTRQATEKRIQARSPVDELPDRTGNDGLTAWRRDKGKEGSRGDQSV